MLAVLQRTFLIAACSSVALYACWRALLKHPEADFWSAITSAGADAAAVVAGPIAILIVYYFIRTGQRDIAVSLRAWFVETIAARPVRLALVTVPFVALFAYSLFMIMSTEAKHITVEDAHGRSAHLFIDCEARESPMSCGPPYVFESGVDFHVRAPKSTKWVVVWFSDRESHVEAVSGWSWLIKTPHEPARSTVVFATPPPPSSDVRDEVPCRGKTLLEWGGDCQAPRPTVVLGVESKGQTSPDCNTEVLTLPEFQALLLVLSGRAGFPVLTGRHLETNKEMTALRLCKENGCTPADQLSVTVGYASKDVSDGGIRLWANGRRIAGPVFLDSEKKHWCTDKGKQVQ